MKSKQKREIGNANHTLNIALQNWQIQHLILTQKCSLRLCSAATTCIRTWLLYISLALVLILPTEYVHFPIGYSEEKRDYFRCCSQDLKATILSRNHDR
jgi:hypothetical protein